MKICHPALPLLLLAACAAPPSRQATPPESVGVADVERTFVFSATGVTPGEIRVGQARIPLGERLFTLTLEGVGTLGPEDFTVDRTDGFGTTQARIHLTALRHPLEAELVYAVRLGDPSFEKTLRLRWNGSYAAAPRLDHVVLEDIPLTGKYTGGGVGSPLLAPGLFLLHSTPWGRIGVAAGRVRVAEEPRVTLGGGWWNSGAAVIGPSGRAPSASAYLRWLVNRRGSTPLQLMVEGDEAATPLVAPGGTRKRPGPALLPFTTLDAGHLKPPASPARRVEKSTGPPELPPRRAVALRLAPGTDPASPGLVRALLAGWGRLPGGGLLVLDGLPPAAPPRALHDLLGRCRALADASRRKRPLTLAVRWTGQGTPAPLWSFWLEHQQAAALPAAPRLGRALLALEPWRRRGEPWSPGHAAALVRALARGTGCIHLGVLPPAGPGRRFLRRALEWAHARDGLLQVMRSPLPGELAAADPTGLWIGRRKEELLLLVEGRGERKLADLLPRRSRWDTVQQVYPTVRRLEGGVLPAGAGGVRVVHAWTGKARPAEPLGLSR